jgi:5-methylcytosine-specific restriction endonuclease McrA
MKRRSDIAKLVSHCRIVWRQSVYYQQAKKLTKIDGKSGWFKCQRCERETEKIQIDHVVAIGRQPQDLEEFGKWLIKLFCGADNLSGICTDCHKKKTKEDRFLMNRG